MTTNFLPQTNPSSQLFFFGGTFDPVHRGHSAIVRRILEVAPLAKVVVMPAAAPPLKGGDRLFSFRERFHFLRLLFRREIEAGQVILSSLEKWLPQPNYTLQTLRALQNYCASKPVVVIGADQAQNLPHWHMSAELIRDYEFLVFARRGSTAVTLAGFNPHIIPDFDEDISATQLRTQLLGLSQVQRQKRVLELLG